MTPAWQIADPIHRENWDTLVLSTKQYTFFHSSAWAKVLAESYGYRPLYFCVFDQEKLIESIPMMEVISLFTGKRGVCLPFSDYCPPVLAQGDRPIPPWEDIKGVGKEKKWKYVEVRGGENPFSGADSTRQFYVHGLDLEQGEAKLFSSFRESTRRNIKKAVRQKVEAIVCNDPGSLMEYYRLHCATRKRQGLPPQPAMFFKKIYDHIISQNKGFIILAMHQGVAIAGAVFFLFGGRVLFKYGASEKRYQHFRPNNLVMWEAIKASVQNGYSHFCFGRTDPNNTGLVQFKDGWGAEKETIHYYRYYFKNGKTDDNIDAYSNRAAVLFRKMPLFFSKYLGSKLYRHVG